MGLAAIKMRSKCASALATFVSAKSSLCQIKLVAIANKNGYHLHAVINLEGN